MFPIEVDLSRSTFTYDTTYNDGADDDEPPGGVAGEDGGDPAPSEGGQGSGATGGDWAADLISTD